MNPIITNITTTDQRVHISTPGFGFNTLHRPTGSELWQWHEAVANAVANHHAQVMGQLLPCPEPKAQTPQAYVTEADTVFCANCWEEREQDPGDRDPNGWLSRQRDWGGSDCCESCGTEDGLEPVYLQIPDLAPKKHPDQLAQDLIDSVTFAEPEPTTWFVGEDEYRKHKGWIQARNKLNPEWVTVDTAEPDCPRVQTCLVCGQMHPSSESCPTCQDVPRH